jgi:hypothetical protein
MKKSNKTKKPKDKVVKELAQHFEEDLKKSLPISIQPNGNIVYKEYYIKKNANANWGLFRLTTHDQINEFYLKTCALMAAKAYSKVQLEKFTEIKQADNRYWANYCDTQIYRKNIKTAKDFDRYLILLNKLEHTEFLAEHYKEEISRMFKWSFV